MITSREVDIYVNRYGIQATIPLVQYDSGRRIIFRIVDATMPSNSTAYIFVRKPSGKAVYILSTVSGNTVTVNLTDQSLAEYGTNFAQIRILKNDEVITSFDVIFDVKQSYADVAVESESGVAPAKLIDDIAVINARVDAFEALEDGSTTGDAELIDGRIGYNGTTYGTIGTAIRSQASSLDQRIRAIEDGSDISAEDVDYDGSGSGLSATNVQDAIDEVVDSIGSQTGDTVPAEVKNAIYILLSKAAYIETGLSDELAIVEAWTATTLTITNRLTRCTISNTSTSIASRSSYSATLTANSGYILNSIKVTMGGVDITSTVYSSGTITIPSVTGNIVITAVAVQAVSSISVVYTQSGMVYDTDALDTLKADLVVTATYSDSTTATVPSSDYTLSGTLEAGTSTVTASYGGKTATFSVTVSTHVLFEVTNRAVDKTTACVDTGLEFLKTDHDFTILFDGTQTDAIPAGNSQRLFFCASADTSWKGVFCGGGNNTGNYSVQWYGVSTANIGANRNSTNARMRIAYRHTAGSDKAVIATKLNSNSIVRSEPSYTFVSNGNAHLFIGGASAGDTTANWVGTIARCTVYDNVLTDEEVAAFLA